MYQLKSRCLVFGSNHQLLLNIVDARTTKALTRLHVCAGSSEPLMVTLKWCDTYPNLKSCSILLYHKEIILWSLVSGQYIVARFNQSQFCGNCALQSMGFALLSEHRGLVMSELIAHKHFLMGMTVSELSITRAWQSYKRLFVCSLKIK